MLSVVVILLRVVTEKKMCQTAFVEDEINFPSGRDPVYNVQDFVFKTGIFFPPVFGSRSWFWRMHFAHVRRQ
jgi:hypothetical protein